MLLFTTLLLSAAVIACIAAGVLEWQYYPNCVPAACSLKYAAAILSYLFLAMLPVLHAGKEALAWKSLRQSI